MEQDIKKLVLGVCEVTDVACQVIVEIAKVTDPVEDLDLPQEHEVFREVQDHD